MADADADMHEDEDDACVARFRAGDEAAFDALVRCHQRAMLRFARYYVGDASAAQDAVQDAFVELHRALAGRYEARGAFRGYLFRIVLNQCRMADRKSRTRARLEAAA